MNKNRLMTGIVLAIFLATGAISASDAPRAHSPKVRGQNRTPRRFSVDAKAMAAEEESILSKIEAGFSDESTEMACLSRLLAIVRSTYEANGISFVVAYMNQPKEDRDLLRHCLVEYLPNKFRRCEVSEALSTPAGSPCRRTRSDFAASARIDSEAVHALRFGRLSDFAEKIQLLILRLVAADMYDSEGLFALWAYTNMSPGQRLAAKGDFLATLDKYRKASF
ncbi:MAG: hypothetical protein QG604_55 [Candidatus Dependentiae bacterium]|nr:hypothetical protein [Candidatus Dependentiae bacterium]